MDLCGDKLLQYLPAESDWQVESQRPPYRRRFCPAKPGCSSQSLFQKVGVNADRLLNRWWTYPRFIRRYCQQYELFHVVDHSYAFLVHQLPSDRSGVFCHDLDAFRCLTQPDLEPRPWWFRKMAERILSGLQQAAVVFHSTEAVRNDLVRFGLLDPEKLVQANYGVDPDFRVADPNVECPTALSVLEDFPWLLHVGATIPRKRMDVLLAVLAISRQLVPELRLCKIGGDWTAEQQAQIDRHDLSRSIIHLGKVSQSLLVQAYQRASAVVITSDAEGFGLPVIEALACGAAVIASDIPVLREVGGDAVSYCPVGDIDVWAGEVVKILSKPNHEPDRQLRLSRAALYTWENHARVIADAYRRIGN